MQCVIIDDQKRILAEKDINGTLWEASYNAFFNKDSIRIECSVSGFPAITQLQDDIKSTILCQVGWTSVPNVHVGDTIIFPPGRFTISWFCNLKEDKVIESRPSILAFLIERFKAIW